MAGQPNGYAGTRLGTAGGVNLWREDTKRPNAPGERPGATTKKEMNAK